MPGLYSALTISFLGICTENRHASIALFCSAGGGPLPLGAWDKLRRLSMALLGLLALSE